MFRLRSSSPPARRIGWAWLAAFLVVPLAAFAQGPAHLVKDINTLPDPDTDANPSGFVTIDGVTYFSANDGVYGTELWRTDGSSDDTFLVKDINPGEDGSAPRSLTEMAGVLYFVAGDREHQCGLWRSDGTEDGTVALRGFGGRYDCVPSLSSPPRRLTSAGGKLFFSAYDEHGYELWVTDGTTNGTVLVKDINTQLVSGQNGSSAPVPLTDLTGVLLFTADDGVQGRKLWVSDGTTDGTRLLADINPASNGPDPPSLTVEGAEVYFVAADDENCLALWRTDGTDAGTMLVKDLVPGTTSDCVFAFGLPKSEVTSANGLHFVVGVSGHTSIGLWVSDGTSEGTKLLQNFILGPGIDSGPPMDLTAAGNALFFAVPSLAGPLELWKTDGTQAGTVFLKDLGGDESWGRPFAFVAADGRLYAAVNDGCDLWTSDGTSDGTRLVWDIESAGSACRSASGIDPHGSLALVNAQGRLLFTPNDATHGRELWAAPLAALLGCPGDCDENRRVTIDELVQGVNIILGVAPTNACSRLDLDGSGAVTIDELATAVDAAINGCGG